MLWRTFWTFLLTCLTSGIIIDAAEDPSNMSIHLREKNSIKNEDYMRLNKVEDKSKMNSTTNEGDKSGIFAKLREYLKAYLGGQHYVPDIPAAPASGGFGGGSATRPTIIPVLIDKCNNTETGSYNWSVTISKGHFSPEDKDYLEESIIEGSGVAVEGSFKFSSPDDQNFTITYSADDKGSVYSEEHLSAPPLMPEAILTALIKDSTYKGEIIYDTGHLEKGIINATRCNTSESDYK